MNKVTISLALGLMVVAAVSVLRAQDETMPTKIMIFVMAQDLHDKCRLLDEDSFPPGSSRPDNLAIQGHTGFCVGYIVGIAETVDVKWWSPPETLKERQLVAVVKKYIDDHPEKWDQPASMLVRNALIEAFPPKKQ